MQFIHRFDSALLEQFRRSRRNAAGREARGIGGVGCRDRDPGLTEQVPSAGGAYDLFVRDRIRADHQGLDLSSGRLALLNSTMLFAAFIGVFVFGRFADVIGRSACTG